jgi:hypothetical protein
MCTRDCHKELNRAWYERTVYPVGRLLYRWRPRVSGCD